MEEIERIIEILRKSFRVVTPIDTSLIEENFNRGQYELVINHIRKSLGVSCKFLVKCLSNYPSTCPPAYIRLPSPFPLFGSTSYENLRLEIVIRKDVLDSFHKFMVVMSHEMSHVVLYGINHSLRKSEKATDITAMMLGFGLEYLLSRNRWSQGDYLNSEEIFYVNLLLGFK